MNRLRYWLLSALLCLPFCGRADAQDSGQTAFDLNEKAISYLWNNLDSAEQYARFALDVTRRHSDEHAKAVNTLARIAFMRMDYTQAWDLYSQRGLWQEWVSSPGIPTGLPGPEQMGDPTLKGM